MNACDTLFGISAAMGRKILVACVRSWVGGGRKPTRPRWATAGPSGTRTCGLSGGIVWSFAATGSHPRGDRERAGDKKAIRVLARLWSAHDHKMTRARAQQFVVLFIRELISA
jgi:hypothetical protein